MTMIVTLPCGHFAKQTFIPSSFRLKLSTTVITCGQVSEWTHKYRLYSRTATVVPFDRLRSDEIDPKPFSAVPGPKGLPLIGTLLSLPKVIREKNHHEVTLKRFAEYGPIWKAKVGSMEIVNLADVDAVEKLHRLEGKYPRRIILEPWRHWREERNYSKGILIQDGPEWKRMRVLLDKQMLRPKSVAYYDVGFNQVSEAFLHHLRNIRDSTNENNTVPNLNIELFHWSLEAIGTVLYEIRLGNFSAKKNPDIQEFIAAVHNLILTTAQTLYMPVKLNRLLIPKVQRRHENAWEVVFRVGAKLIDQRVNDLKKRLEIGDGVSGFLSTLLASQMMSTKEVYANISELMVAAVDTTSNTMQWVFHTLAKKPDIQQKLHREVSAVLKPGEPCSYQHVQSMPYLKAVVKETLRMYPVAGVITRVLNEDMVLAGYRIPKDTLVLGNSLAMGRDPEQFPDPLQFKPERWLRNNTNQVMHTFAWLPFGFGPRMCIGRRVAELEMQILLAKLSQTYELKPADDKELKLVAHGLLIPEESVNVQLIDR